MPQKGLRGSQPLAIRETNAALAVDSYRYCYPVDNTIIRMQEPEILLMADALGSEGDNLFCGYPRRPSGLPSRVAFLAYSASPLDWASLAPE